MAKLDWNKAKIKPRKAFKLAARRKLPKEIINLPNGEARFRKLLKLITLSQNTYELLNDFYIYFMRKNGLTEKQLVIFEKIERKHQQD